MSAAGPELLQLLQRMQQQQEEEEGAVVPWWGVWVEYASRCCC
jgi:hypothetical protein